MIVRIDSYVYPEHWKEKHRYQPSESFVRLFLCFFMYTVTKEITDENHLGLRNLRCQDIIIQTLLERSALDIKQEAGNRIQN